MSTVMTVAGGLVCMGGGVACAAMAVKSVWRPRARRTDTQTRLDRGA